MMGVISLTQARYTNTSLRRIVLVPYDNLDSFTETLVTRVSNLIPHGISRFSLSGNMDLSANNILVAENAHLTINVCFDKMYAVVYVNVKPQSKRAGAILITSVSSHIFDGLSCYYDLLVSYGFNFIGRYVPTFNSAA